ncbi:MAG: DUF2341 domain-containing protein, partial [Candidatus Nanoarchaeia archaeon]|nr:DUF2341 domain-containing protein [Candidatus Haiyanarchaeum thermophilum]
MKLRIPLFILFLIILIVSLPRFSFGFYYSYSISINNTQNSNSLSNYPVRIVVDTYTLISQGKMRSDCGDIRFSTYSEDWNVATGLPYWIESGCNTASTVIWVNVSSIPASSTTTIYMFFGNSSITSISNPDGVFKFFDGFSTLDTTKWDCSGSCTVSNGIVSISSNSYLSSKSTFSPYDILEFRGAISAYTGDNYIYRGYYYSTDYFACLYTNSTSYFYFWVRSYTSSGFSQLTYETGWRIWGIVRTGTDSWKLYRDYSFYAGLDYSGGTSAYKAYFQVVNTGVIYVDWVRVRKFSYPEPIASVNYTLRYNPQYCFSELGSSNLCAGKEASKFYKCENSAGCTNSLGNPSKIPYQSTYYCSGGPKCYAYDVDDALTICSFYVSGSLRCPPPGCWNMGGSPCLATPPGVDGQYSAYGCNLYCCGDDPNEYRINTTIVNLTPFQNFTYSSTTDLYGCCNSSFSCIYDDKCYFSQQVSGMIGDAVCVVNESGSFWIHGDDN